MRNPSTQSTQSPSHAASGTRKNAIATACMIVLSLPPGDAGMTRERAENMPEDDWRSRNPQFREPLLSRNLAIAEELARIGREHGRSAGEVAIAWTLRLPAVTGAIVGARSAEQVEGVMSGGDFRLSDEEVARIEALRGRE